MRRTRQPAVTVAVVVKNRRDWMARCLDAILAQTGVTVDVDILVVDNGSTDGTYEFLLERAQDAPDLRVVQDLGSLGHIRNVALHEAQGRVVAFTDSDCVPEPTWLAAGLRELTEGVGVVQGRTVPIRPVGSWEATISVTSFSHRYETCNIFYDREALLSVGGFGAAMPQIGEDMVAGWRVREAGWQTVFAEAAVVAHEVTYPTIRWWLRRAWRYECWPQLIKEFPAARDVLLYRRYFLNRRQVMAIAAVLGAVASVALLSPWPALLIVPLVWRWRPSPRRGRTVRNSCCAVLYDVACLGGLIRGSLKARVLVL
ncbi:MAG TPA: glycosyltransferase [Mycobacteriales bacterium]|nr:glycosyltransferase [Mycobacteriales bacterium]